MSNHRGNHTVLVTESHTIGSLAIIRSLGRAGYRVLGCSPQRQALGFHSRYCHLSLVQPRYDQNDRFITWIDQLIQQEAVSLIIPSESFLLAIRSRFSHYRHLLPCSRNEARVYGALSKYDLFQSCRDAGLREHLPPFVLLEAADPVPDVDALRALGQPLFLKVDGVYALQGQDGAVIRCEDADAALAQIDRLRQQYRKVMIQGYVTGVGVGVFLASWNDQTLAEFMHRRLHEVPHTGGASSFRESWHHDKILADAWARMRRISWQGVGMFEYRWNPENDDFYLMEFNSRFWGSLHLALFAGVDFPAYWPMRFLVTPILRFGSTPPSAAALLSRGKSSMPYPASRIRDYHWGRGYGPWLSSFGWGSARQSTPTLIFPEIAPFMGA